MQKMKELDYFTTERRNNFNIFTFTLNLNFTINKMDINQYSLFVHEYTHYLQSIGTVNGISLLFKYFSFVKDISKDITHKICSDEEYDTDFLTDYKDKYDEIKLLYNYTLDKENSENYPDYHLSYEKIEHPIFRKTVNEYFITLGNKNYHVSQKCLRETMAMMTFFHARHYTIQEALDYLNQDSIEPIYKILLLHFYHNYKFSDDLIIFTYYFSELALQTDNPNDILDKLFKLLRYRKTTADINTETFIKIFKYENKNFETRLKFLLAKLTKDIDDLKLLEVHNEYFTAVKEYLGRCIVGLTNYVECTSFIDRFESLESIKEFSKQILSPIIISNDEKDITVSTLDDQTNKYSMALIFAVARLLDSYIKGDDSPMFSKCIFMEQIPICSFFKKKKNDVVTKEAGDVLNIDVKDDEDDEDENKADINICSRKPFYIKPFPKGNCIFYNANLVLGLLPDEEIQKYKENVNKKNG